MTILTGNANCIRYVLFVFNFLFTITGIILIAIGARASGAFDTYEPFLETKFFSLPTFLIVIGVFIFIIAFFGCYGAFRENYCMVLTFSILLIMIFIFELAAGISGYVLRDDTAEFLEKRLTDSMKDYKQPDHKDIQKTWDYIHQYFVCCGVHNYTDWTNAISGIPMSCCDPEPGAVDSVSCAPKDHPNFHMKGCIETFTEYITQHALSLGGAGIAFAVIQFVAIFFSCYVAREIKRRNGGSAF